ncbi:MAG: Hint domain-containing protein [Paracoccus sp. (in: a-proteobacteria)]
MAGERSITTFSVDRDLSDADQDIDALLVGRKWDTSVSNVLTYSFPDSPDDFSYTRPNAEFANQFSATQQVAAEHALSIFSDVADVVFEEMGDDAGESNADGTIRFLDATRTSGTWVAYGAGPRTDEYGGDMYFRDGRDGTVDVGDYEYYIMVHELGHVMGLRHGHATAGQGAMTDEHNSMEYSIMTYSSYIGHDYEPRFMTNATGHYAQTLMMYDIAAVQRMYGANFDAESDDSVYSVDPATGEMSINGVGQGEALADVTFRTVWDGNGKDTYDFSNFTTDLSLDLRPGQFIDLDVGGELLRARLNAGHTSTGSWGGVEYRVYASGHIYNALQYEGDARSLIENAIGGTGADLLIGNIADNALSGGDGNDTLSGGEGDDTLSGGNGADRFIHAAGSGHDIITDFDVITGIGMDPDNPRTADSSDNDFIDLSPFYDSIFELRQDQLDDGVLNQSNTVDISGEAVDYSDNARFDDSLGGMGSLTLQSGGAAVSASSLTYENTNVACFTQGTLIETAEGERPIESLRAGDLVRTLDHGFQPIRWIGSRRVDAQELAGTPYLKPVQIRAGALSAQIPERDLLVSPQHRILVRSEIAQRMFGTREILIGAKHLLVLDGVDIVEDPGELVYVHMLFDRHEIVISNGAASESLFTGAEAMKSLSEGARAEIRLIFPEICGAGYIPQACRLLAPGRKGRKLAERHHRNRKSLAQ